jgi:hypothetical protein
MWLIMFASWMLMIIDFGVVLRAEHDNWRDSDKLFIRTVTALQAIVTTSISLIMIFT